jgi:hypothetical protein
MPYLPAETFDSRSTAFPAVAWAPGLGALLMRSSRMSVFSNMRYDNRRRMARFE